MTLFTSSLLFDTIGIIATLVAVFYAYVWWSHQYWKRRNVPYLEPQIPWGNFGNPRSRDKSLTELMRSVYAQAKATGNPYCGVYGISTPNFLVLDLDILKHIMTKDFHNFVDRGLYTNERDDPLSCHLFAIGGTKWKNLRAKLSPTFTSGKLKSMFSTLVECGMVLEKYIDKYPNKCEGVDIKDVLGNFSTDIIGSCAFGLECNSFEDPDSLFRYYGKKIFAGSTLQNLKIAISLNFPKVAEAFRMVLTPKDVADFFMKVVNDTVTYREKNNYRRNDFLQLLIDVKNDKNAQNSEHKGDGKTLTMEELAAQSFVFFAAGFETSSTTMTFALFELAQHQDIQEKVRKEIREVLAKHDNKVTYDSLNELKYMKQVIDEALRMYSPVPFLTRVAAQDYKIPNHDVVLEKGTRVMIPIVGIHHDEDHYPNPSVFDPDRFSEENRAARHPYAHIPFGEGPRICIGERFGIMQTKVGLTTILRNFRVTLNEKTKLPLKFSSTSFVPSVETGVYLNVERV